jgi:hypothetical protein
MPLSPPPLTLGVLVNKGHRPVWHALHRQQWGGVRGGDSAHCLRLPGERRPDGSGALGAAVSERDQRDSGESAATERDSGVHLCDRIRRRLLLAVATL